MKQVYEPGQTSEWHTHPGLHAVAVLTGELTVTTTSADPNGSPQPYVGGRELHLVRNETSDPVEMIVTYLNAVGSASPHNGVPAGCPAR